MDVVLARDADDADVTEAFAAALLTCRTVPLPAAQVKMLTTLACRFVSQPLAKREVVHSDEQQTKAVVEPAMATPQISRKR